MKNVVVLDKKALLEIANGEKKIDNRTNNTGRPVNKQSARQARLAKQAFYNDVNAKFQKGNQFRYNNALYKYVADKNGGLGHIVTVGIIDMHACNVSYIGRTKVQGYTFVMGKKMNVELDLKTLVFVK
jgi:hypothetical protein